MTAHAMVGLKEGRGGLNGAYGLEHCNLPVAKCPTPWSRRRAIPHSPLQTFDRIRCKVALARPDVDPRRHVLNQQKPPIDPDVVGHALFDQRLVWW